MRCPRRRPPRAPPLDSESLSHRDSINLFSEALRWCERRLLVDPPLGLLLLVANPVEDSAVWRGVVRAGAASDLCVPAPTDPSACENPVRGFAAQLRIVPEGRRYLDVQCVVGPRRSVRDNTWLVGTEAVGWGFLFIRSGGSWALVADKRFVSP